MEAVHPSIGEILAFRTGRFKPKDTMKKIITSSQKRKKQEKRRKKRYC